MWHSTKLIKKKHKRRAKTVRLSLWSRTSSCLTTKFLSESLHAMTKLMLSSKDWKPGEESLTTGLMCGCNNKIASRCRAPRPPMTDVGTETTFTLDQRKNFQKSKHFLRSEVSWCDQTSIDLHLRRSIYKWEDRSACSASRISTQKEPFPRSEFTLGSIWTYWMMIDRQMQSDFMSELHRWISKLTARHLQILHQEIFWSLWHRKR